MAKAKAKAKPSKAKKDKKSSDLPKKIAGVKLPKAIKSNSLLTLFNSDLGREIMADALIAAAGAAAAALTRTRTVKAAGNAAAEAGTNAASATSDAVQTAAGAVAGVVTEAARSFLPSSLVGENRNESEGDEGDKPRYMNLSSDHSSRKQSKSEDMGGKPGKR
jgi:hypothetical protein